jgi:hypothetical protein
MTEDRDFKDLVRERAAKTGESYQQAWRHLRGAGAEPVDAMRDRAEQLDLLEAERSSAWVAADFEGGRQLADLALRMADGKPVAPGLVIPHHLRELWEEVRAATANAASPGADRAAIDERDALRQRYEMLVSRYRAEHEAPTPEEYLRERSQLSLDRVLIARRKCSQLLELNPRDMVALNAYERLSELAAHTADSLLA